MLTIWQTVASVDHLWVVHDGVELFHVVGPVLPSQAYVDAVEVLGNWVVPGDAIGVR